MSKVKKEIVEAAILKFMTSVTATMPTVTHKFLMGSVSALAALGDGRRINQLLGLAADEEGYIDVDQMKAVVKGGFAATGGKMSIDLFRNNMGLLSMLVSPLTLTITENDVQAVMTEIEMNAVQTARMSNEVPEHAENAAVQAAVPAK